MRGFLCKSAAAGLLAAAHLMIAVPAAAAGVSVRTLAAQEARLATMAYRMATANANVCSRPEMMTGMILHDLTQYQPARRAEVERAFSLQTGIGILQLVPGSVAARAGLQIDDEILAVGNVSVEDPTARYGRSTSFRRMQAFSDTLQSRLANGPVQLLVRRNHQLQRVTLAGERGCGGRFTLASSSGLNAWSDGRHIVLTTGMYEFARSDDEIAFVIAHEMAHNILGHFGRPSRRGIFGSPRARNYELDADGFAVRVMSEAGYQPGAGITFLEHSRRRLWWAFSLDHPGFGSRIRTVTAEITKWQQARLPDRQAVAAHRPAGGNAVTANAGTAPRITTMSRDAPMFSQSTQAWRQTFGWRLEGPALQP